MAIDTDIPNDVYSNLVQIVVLSVATVIPAACKRRCIDNDRRCRKQWRMDVIRQIVLTINAIATLLLIAIVYNGDDVLNLITLISADIVLGTGIDAMMLSLLRNSGARIGFYGRPMAYNIAVWHTVAAITLCVAARCTSAIAAICLFPFVNSHVEVAGSVATQFIVLGLPSMYAAARMIILDQFFRQHDGYDAMKCTETLVESESAFAIEDDESPREIHSHPSNSSQTGTGEP